MYTATVGQHCCIKKIFSCCVRCWQDDWDEEAHPEGFILGGAVPPPAPAANGDQSEAGMHPSLSPSVFSSSVLPKALVHSLTPGWSCLLGMSFRWAAGRN